MSRPRGRRIAAPPPERVARRRFAVSPTAVLGVLVPALAIGALALVPGPDPAPSADHPPREQPLRLAVLACPSDLGGDERVSVASASGATGEVEIEAAGDQGGTSVTVPRDDVATVTVGTAAQTVRGRGRMAPGMLAARQDVGPAAASCAPAASDQWFTGLGAAARHSSVVELVNPDPGPAVADLTVLGPGGPVDAPQLRGITVPGGRSLRLDLSQEIPRRGELSVRVEVSRGRLGAFAADAFDELGQGAAGADWLAPQLPATESTLLGLAPGAGTRALVLANPGEDEVQATLRVVTEDSAFLPEGLDEVRVPPESVVRVPLSSVLDAAIQDGAVGLSVEASHPVTATLRSFVAGDVSHAVPVAPVTSGTESILPVVADATVTALLAGIGVGSAKVVAFTADGRKQVERVELAPGRTVSVSLPAETVLVRVTPEGTSLRGAVLVAAPPAADEEPEEPAGPDDTPEETPDEPEIETGATVVGLRDLLLTGQVPDARPALP